MTKRMQCWRCGGEVSVGAELVGTTVKCLHCSATVHVPGELFDAQSLSIAASRGQSAANKSPMRAAVLNFFVWGAGYVYLGCMGGLWILLPFCFLLGVRAAQTETHTPSTVTILLVNFVGLGLATHAYGMAKAGR